MLKVSSIATFCINTSKLYNNDILGRDNWYNKYISRLMQELKFNFFGKRKQKHFNILSLSNN
jgi:hypothetical protein